VDICDQGFSPPAAGCPTTPVTQNTLTLNLNGAGIGAVASSQPAGIACTKPVAAATQVCTAQYNDETTVSLFIQAQDGGGAPTNATFTVSGACALSQAPTAQTAAITVVMSEARTCTVALSP
jgi:hypothetical protein